MNRDMCHMCKNKSIGCEKFCSTYKSSFDLSLHNIITNSRIAQREQEIAHRLRRRVKKNESK